MYCPKCGKENPEDQKYCRSCGLHLQTVALALSDEEAPARKSEGLAESVGNELRGWRSPLIFVALVLIVGLTVRTIGDKVLGDKSAADIGTIIALLGVLVLLLKGIMVAVIGAVPPAGSKEPGPTARTTQLPRPLLSAEPPSVTEQTTRQLDPALEKGQSRDTQPTQ